MRWHRLIVTNYVMFAGAIQPGLELLNPFSPLLHYKELNSLSPTNIRNYYQGLVNGFDICEIEPPPLASVPCGLLCNYLIC